MVKEETWYLENCNEFVEKGRKYLVVRLGQQKDWQTGRSLDISDIDTLLRLSMYKGKIYIDSNKNDAYFLFDMANKYMANFYGENIDYFVNNSAANKIFEFQEFVKLNVMYFGRFATYFSDGKKEVHLNVE